jgi:hypothetical protein
MIYHNIRLINNQLIYYLINMKIMYSFKKRDLKQKWLILKEEFLKTNMEILKVKIKFRIHNYQVSKVKLF